LSKFVKLLNFVKENCDNLIDAYKRIDLINFIQKSRSFMSIKHNLEEYEIASRFNSVSEFIKEYKKSLLNSDSNEEPCNFYELIFCNPDINDYSSWTRLILWDFLSGLHVEIDELDFDSLTINPYVGSILNLSTEDTVKIAYNQSMSRKISGKWGNTGEEILRHFSLVRSQLREFDLKKWNGKHYIHYEIKATPDKTMRGAEQKKFFEVVIPNYQKKYPNDAFIYGGLYSGDKSNVHNKKIAEVIEAEKEINFIAKKRWVIAGKELWKEITNLEDPIGFLYKEFNIIANCFLEKHNFPEFGVLLDTRFKEIFSTVDKLDKEKSFHKLIG